MLLTHYSTAAFAGHFFIITSTQQLVSCTAVPLSHCVMLHYMLAAQLFLQPQPRISHVTQCRLLIVLCCIICLLLNSFFSLSPKVTRNALPSSDCVMLHYMLAVQLFLQPQPERHM